MCLRKTKVGSRRLLQYWTSVRETKSSINGHGRRFRRLIPSRKLKQSRSSQGTIGLRQTAEATRQIPQQSPRRLPGVRSTAADAKTLGQHRGYLQDGQFVATIRKTLAKDEFLEDLVIGPARIGDAVDDSKYTEIMTIVASRSAGQNRFTGNYGEVTNSNSACRRISATRLS